MIYFLLFLLCTARLYSFAEQLNRPEASNGQELLLCRKCGSDVADSYYMFTKPSPGARKTEKRNLFGKQNVTVQTLINPFGVKFDLITTTKARCDNVGSPQAADTWFPGYTWRVCACPHCGHNLGWTFESLSDKINNNSEGNNSMFHGLILSNILGENYSLLMMPKTYQM